MILLLRMFSAIAPAGFKRRELHNLFRLTASAFGSPFPRLAGLSFDRCLSEYARFTRSEAVKVCVPGGDKEGAAERLFQGGRMLGGRIRRLCLVATFEDAVQAMRILYRTIGIHSRSEGCTMTVSSCYFSSTYSSEVCSLVSALDDGIFSGLSGGGRLKFNRRLTDGSACCSAEVIPAGGSR